MQYHCWCLMLKNQAGFQLIQLLIQEIIIRYRLKNSLCIYFLVLLPNNESGDYLFINIFFVITELIVSSLIKYNPLDISENFITRCLLSI